MISGWFQEDDYDILYRVSGFGPFGIWTHAPTYFFRPVISLLFWLQYQASGLSPLPYRVVNDLLHAGVATMVGLLVYELKPDRRVAIAASALFLCWPSHAETVNWIAARTDLCGTLFGLASLVAFLRWQREPARGARLVGSLALFAMALLSKESAVLVPLMALALAWGNRSARELAPAAGGFVGVGLLYAGLRMALMGPALQGNLSRATGAKLLGAVAAEVSRTFLPGLPFGDPSLNNSEAMHTGIGVIYLAAGLLAALALAVWAWRRPSARALATCYLIALLPAAGLSVRLFRSQGERFVYFPSVFAVILLALALFELRPRAAVATTSALCLAGAALLQWQNLYWRQGAELSQAVSASFARDVVASNGSAPVALLDVPASVQGGYGVAYVFDSAAPLLRPGQHPRVTVVSVLRLNEIHHRIDAATNGSRVSLTATPGAAFDAEDTLTAWNTHGRDLSDLGFTRFARDRVEYDLGRLPIGERVYYWNGQEFRPVR